MSIDSKLKKFLQSNEGKKHLTESQAKALKSGSSFGQGSDSISIDDALEAAEKQREILLSYLQRNGLDSITKDDIIIGDPVVDADGNIVVDLRFHPDSVFRPSLVPEEYPDGIENIVVHLTHGWSARGSVRGYWERIGRDVWSRKSSAGRDFMQRAVEDFNALGIGFAELDDKYL